MNNTDTSEIKDQKLIDVIISDDGMTGYIKLVKQGNEKQPVTAEELTDALKKNNVVYGIKENSVKMLAARPIYGIKIEVAHGLAPVDGEDGYVNYFVKRDSEYKPEFNEEGNIDYKNLDYFQYAKAGQVLCEIVKETDGTDGINVMGVSVPAKRGRPPLSPLGKNTEFNEDETKLIASCNGVIRFIRDTIDVNEVLEIRSNVDQNTGNINFTGDVIVNGDVCYGFAVKSGGNVTVKGVVEGASIEAAGSVNVGKGINGASREKITAGGDLRSRYIENAELYVEGDITADYIIDSNITCHGNIELAGKNEVIIGGSVRILGELTARYIGNENERPTRIEVIGVEVVDNEAINRLITEREGYNAEAQKIIESYEQLCSLQNAEDEEEMQDQLDNIRRKLVSLKDRIDYTSKMIENLKKEVTYEYRGSISCKRKLYQGVRIYFGGTVFRFDSDNLEHCRIFCSDGEIINGTL